MDENKETLAERAKSKAQEEAKSHGSIIGLSFTLAFLWGLFTQALCWGSVLDWPWYAIWGPMLIVIALSLIPLLLVLVIAAGCGIVYLVKKLIGLVEELLIKLDWIR